MDKRELFCIILWRIWFLRNSAVHNAKRIDKDETISWCEKYLADYQSFNAGTWNRGRDLVGAIKRVGWSPPDTDEYKTNGGIAIDSKTGQVGLGIVIRNSEGDVMACCAQKLTAYICSKDANALAILKGIQFGIDCGLNSRQIESNDGLIVKWINLGLNRDSEVGKILSDIDDLGTALGNVCFCHIPFQANGVAVGLAKLALRIAEDKFWMEEFPRTFIFFFLDDMDTCSASSTGTST